MAKARAIVDHLFRHETGHIISKLSARYGMLHLAEIEDAVAEALARAMKSWIVEVPESPGGWLYRVATRILLDTLRRKQRYYDKVIPGYVALAEETEEAEDPYATIKLMLWCVHPSIAGRDQLGLILQLVSGFSVREISTALLVDSEALKKRLQRARTKLSSVESALHLPDIDAVHDRFPILRSALYLGFNEGYYSIHHRDILREDLIYESMRLCRLLCQTPHPDLGISQALMSLLLYHSSRIPARRSPNQALILFEHQDRKLWDSRMAQLASDYLEQAMESSYYTPYHIEALIAGIHTYTARYQDTDWTMIATLYHQLLDVAPSPLVELNYIYALLMDGRPDEGHRLLIKADPTSYGAHNYLYHAVYALYYKTVGDQERQRQMLWRAIDTAPHEATRQVLRDRLESVG